MYGPYDLTKGINTETSQGSNKHNAIGDDDQIQDRYIPNLDQESEACIKENAFWVLIPPIV